MYPYCGVVSRGQMLLPHGIICDVLMMLHSRCQSQDFFLPFRLVGLLKFELEDLIVKYTVSLYVTFWCVTFDKSSTFQLMMLVQIAWAPVKQERRKPCLNV